MKLGLTMCRLRGVEPSIILHPLDFLGAEDAPEVSFFPGMDLPRDHKLAVLETYLDEVERQFDVVSMSEHARRIEARGASVRPLPAS
jgi:hypothetical protein